MERGFLVEDKHIFTDSALSGSLSKRPALDELREKATQKEFEGVIMDNLSRLGRNQ